ncbi:hypothetical protein KFK09_002716 [Dendrobium nobile]|uniref:Uncharacterized protein n=1 Tax=Dendrobium nobile TaxID=94219 RepID=A0A8T3C4F8_DENNO|nr:hypothetical protein KFK09_002716 [Dendrobium nobile]
MKIHMLDYPSNGKTLGGLLCTSRIVWKILLVAFIKGCSGQEIRFGIIVYASVSLFVIDIINFTCRTVSNGL